MTNDKGILIKNIYYMLSYAFQILKQSNYEQVAAEDFESVQDLFAAILAKGVAKQRKQGLYREYVTEKEDLSVLRGKLDLEGTIRERMRRLGRLACAFDELSEDNLFNQILKTTMYYLAKAPEVKAERRSELQRLLRSFGEISLVVPSAIPWGRLQYQRNNKNYELLLNVCYFVMEGMLQTTEQGEYRMMAFSDEHMERLYEKFILEYYRQEHPELDEVRAAQVKWDLGPAGSWGGSGEAETGRPGVAKAGRTGFVRGLDGASDSADVSFLPVMQTDVFLRKGEKVLILDAKYYGRTMQTQFEKRTLRSAHLYQIYTYVKNQDVGRTGDVTGMLVYAKTEEELTPDFCYNMGGNRIGALTLDLNRNFAEIAAQLDAIAAEFLGRS